MKKNLPVKSSRKSVVVRPKPLPAKQRAHKRKIITKQGRKEILINPDNVQKFISIHKRHISVPARFDTGIRFPAKNLVPKVIPILKIKPSHKVIWDQLMSTPDFKRFFDWTINHNIADFKESFIMEIEEKMKDGTNKEGYDIVGAVEEVLDDIEGGLFEDRWGMSDHVFIKEYNPDFPSFDSVFTDYHDPYDGELFVPNLGSIDSGNFELRLNKKNYYSIDLPFIGSIEDEISKKKDKEFVKNLIDSKIPFKEGIIGTNNTEPTMIIVENKFKKRLQKLFDDVYDEGS